MALDDHDRTRLRRAIALAAKGRYGVEPNPVVGCVLESQGRIVGEGWHAAYGGPHAEVEALLRAGDAARGATAYVSLEPCSTVGKTGACALALAEAGVARVVFASRDPHMGPDLEGEGDRLLRDFLHAASRARPWVVLKWAMTLDGRIAPAIGRGGAITGARTLAFVHDLRAHVDAVIVGVATVLVDDPRLTSRLEGGMPHGRPQPCRVVLDSGLRTPPAARLLESAPDVPVVIFAVEGAPTDRRRALEARGARVREVRAEAGRVDLGEALRSLHEEGARRVLVEGGARVHGAFLRRGLADQVSAFVAPLVLGGDDAPAAVTGTGIGAMDDALRLEMPQWRRLGEDLLLQGFVPPLSGRAGGRSSRR